MNIDEIRAYCLAFPGATEKLQWGDALCFKVRTKMFAVLGLDQVRLTFKCTPDAFAELIERENIGPAPYVGRYKWVKLDRLDALRPDELQDLIRQSYDMVAANAPKSKTVKRGGKGAASVRASTRIKTRNPSSRKKRKRA